MTRNTQTPKPGKLRGAQPYTSKTASFYQKQPASAAVATPLSGTMNGSSTTPASGSNPTNSAQIAANPSASSTLPPNSGAVTGSFKPMRATSSRSFKVALVSLLISLIGLSFIFAMQVEMKGAGAYLYLMVTVSAFVYIVATMVYVVLSTRRSK